MEALKVVANHLEALQVVHVVKHLAAIARGKIAENLGHEDSTTNDLTIAVHGGGHLRNLSASFAVADSRQSCRNLAVKGNPSAPGVCKLEGSSAAHL